MRKKILESMNVWDPKVRVLNRVLDALFYHVPDEYESLSCSLPYYHYHRNVRQLDSPIARIKQDAMRCERV